ncbi:hypothetical protein GCK72_025106 [Caenorhabditis remanei]|uniref:Uncharacterized protein n=1 Tax=Caenorhabditis remanei TaxID=31234 RepID=A0A6A5G280_CAERE|nr:hypothetical protein GCK72_025106 [Caenorhabditis remanei]KAF1748639.1 hypothetical protein GCK72_025106 [Caenorhabditis remanei]
MDFLLLDPRNRLRLICRNMRLVTFRQLQAHPESHQIVELRTILARVRELNEEFHLPVRTVVLLLDALPKLPDFDGPDVDEEELCERAFQGLSRARDHHLMVRRLRRTRRELRRQIRQW